MTAKRMSSGDVLNYRNGLFIPGRYETCFRRSSNFALTLPSLTFMYTDIDGTIGRRVRTYQYDDENERCSVSIRKVQRKDFSQLTGRSTICLTSSAISSLVAHFEYSATGQWRNGKP